MISLKEEDYSKETWNDYQDIIKKMGEALSGSWNFNAPTDVLLLNNELSEMLSTIGPYGFKKPFIIHKVNLYPDIRWYICSHTNKYIKDLKTKEKFKNGKSKIFTMFFLIEVNGVICEDYLEDDLQEILDVCPYGGIGGRNRVVKSYWESIDYIKQDLIDHPLDF